MSGIEIITSIFILIGVFFAFVSSIGLIRLPDVYSRVHAGGKSSTLGVISLMIATFVYFIPQGTVNGKILLAILFVFLTAPLAALMVSRAAYKTGVPLEEKSMQDDLKGMYDQRENE